MFATVGHISFLILDYFLLMAKGSCISYDTFSRMERPVGFARDCKVLFDWKTCSFDVVKKDDQTVKRLHGGVGKLVPEK